MSTPETGKDEIVWHTADGRHLTMAEIDDQHLMNIRNHILGQIDGATHERWDVSGDEMGQDAKDAAIAEIDGDIAKLEDDLRVMTDEAKRRGLISETPTP